MQESSSSFLGHRRSTGRLCGVELFLQVDACSSDVDGGIRDFLPVSDGRPVFAAGFEVIKDRFLDTSHPHRASIRLVETLEAGHGLEDVAAVAVTLVDVIVVVLGDRHLEQIRSVLVYLTAADASCEDALLVACRSSQALVVVSLHVRREHPPRVFVGPELHRVPWVIFLMAKARTEEVVALNAGGLEYLLGSDIDRDAKVLNVVHELLRDIDRRH